VPEYYVLECDRVMDDEGGYLEVDDSIDVYLDPEMELDDWTSGIRLDVKVDRPFVLSARAVRGYTGPPADLYDFRVTLMSERMLLALREVGVDNLDVYPAQVVEEGTGRSWTLFAVNIIGRVAAADLRRSVWSSAHPELQGDVMFDRLVLDPRATMGLPLFRMAESVRTILVPALSRGATELAGGLGLAEALRVPRAIQDEASGMNVSRLTLAEMLNVSPASSVLPMARADAFEAVPIVPVAIALPPASPTERPNDEAFEAANASMSSVVV